jgi:hypothetical protein
MFQHTSSAFGWGRWKGVMTVIIEARPLRLTQALKEDRGRGAFRITTWSSLPVGSLRIHIWKAPP